MQECRDLAAPRHERGCRQEEGVAVHEALDARGDDAGRATAPYLPFRSFASQPSFRACGLREILRRWLFCLPESPPRMFGHEDILGFFVAENNLQNLPNGLQQCS